MVVDYWLINNKSFGSQTLSGDIRIFCCDDDKQTTNDGTSTVSSKGICCCVDGRRMRNLKEGANKKTMNDEEKKAFWKMTVEEVTDNNDHLCPWA